MNFLQNSETDPMLALNEFLQKTSALAYIRFNKDGYFQSSAVSWLFIKKSNIEDLIKYHSNMLIQVIKLLDKRVIRVKALEQ